ncbi:MAG: hypothetical protein LLF87_03840 [Eubacteriales bacterium]|nr:hypothetical protein [Eubacteriales bacterium]
MEKQTAKKKRKWLLPTIAGVVPLLAAAAFFIFRSPQKEVLQYVPGEYPEGVNFADVVTERDFLSGEELYLAYDPDNDPAHPTLDVKVKLSISNLGSRPGVPRPQDAAAVYPSLPPIPLPTPSPSPSPAPSVSINPNIFFPAHSPNPALPGIALPDLFILSPDVSSPQFTGASYELKWSYTAGRKAVFAVALSTNGGESFHELAAGLAEETYTVVFPQKTAERCVLRVTALVEGNPYKTADTAEFALVSAPEPLPTLLVDYVDPQVQYTDLGGVHISSASDLPVWFMAESAAENAEKLIWQLSKVPFWGTKESFGSENAVIAQGELTKEGGEFSIDLKALCETLTQQGRGEGEPFLLAQPRYDFYLRVVPLDSSGACVGDPGYGLNFTYGEARTRAIEAAEPNIYMQFYLPYYWDYRYECVSPGVLNRDVDDKPDEWIRFISADGPHDDSVETPPADGKGMGSWIIHHAVQVELQVATSPFGNSPVLDPAKPKGLVFSDLVVNPSLWESADYGSTYSTELGHGLNYEKFALPKEELDAMGGIYYYVRGVFYVPDAGDPSILRAYPSETTTIAFRATDARENEVKTFTVESNIPFVQFQLYSPVKWPYPNCENIFEVTRHIEAEEMNFTIRNTQTGDFLMPYPIHISLYHWTREQYQAKLDQMLPQYATFTYVEKDGGGFWDEFFGLLRAIYKGIQGAYNGVKSGVINFVADHIPLIGDTARGYLKKAITYAVDYGLASIGLPPNLPNLDVLAEGGMDYVLRYAVEQALAAEGIPIDDPAAAEITQKVREQVGGAITEELKNALRAAQQNPFHADFVRMSTWHQYQPAWVQIYVKNYSETSPSPAGYINFDNGNGRQVYKNCGARIPALPPGEGVVMRLYLEHWRNVYPARFDTYYNGASGEPYTMSFRAQFFLPDVWAAAGEQGVGPAPLPYVTEYVYDRGDYTYTREFIPSEIIFDGDTEADPAAFGGR